MISTLIKLVKWLLAIVLAFVILGVSHDEVHLNPAQRVAAPYIYDLVGWHASNFMSKWFHLALASMPWNSQSDEQKAGKVERYFELGGEIAALENDINEAAAVSGEGLGQRLTELERRLDELRRRRGGLRNDVEETIEATISAVISEEGLAYWAGLIIPPVDIRLTGPPKLLVTSPRDRIHRAHDVLLRSDVGLSERESIEDNLLLESDLAALVLNIGGLATYPASLPSNQPLQWTLRIAAHEWLHHHFFFKPLGQHMFDNANMQTLNETAADMAGRELGDRAFVLLGGVLPPASEGSAGESPTSSADDTGAFDFSREMQETRLRVDELLASGRVEEAEAYMEERRRVFVENRFLIRKLNQAYFAFYGTYAESAASVSPIGDQLHRFRGLVPDAGTFIREVSGMSSYERFLSALWELEGGREAPAPTADPGS